MRIGIITYHRAENYGSALQAYALCRYLQKKGQSPEIIDYHSGAQDQMYARLFAPMRSCMSVARNVQTLGAYRALLRRHARFAHFRGAHLPLSDKEYNEHSDLAVLNDRYDRFICGSDQIWNPSCYDFTDAYLLRFVARKDRCISYAASMGRAELPEESHALFLESLRDFAALSMREEQGAREIGSIVGRDISVVPDPVLLLSADQWRELVPPRSIKEKYIFCYFIGDVDGMRSYAKELYRRTGYRLVVTNKNLRDMLCPCKKRYDTGPLEFLSLLWHSEFVCTDSFHALMFSLIFRKPFRVFVKNGEGSARSRVDHIAARMGLSDRVSAEGDPMPKAEIGAIDFDAIQPQLDAYAERGRAFLDQFLVEPQSMP